ncbi:MAG TPA: ROK family protein [Anaerolineales bacterium]
MEYYIGVDLGGTNLRAAIIDTESGEILCQKKCPTLARQGQEAVIARMLQLIEELPAEWDLAASKIKGVGIGVPGTLNIDQGLILFLTNLPGQWREVPLQQIVQERSGYPVALINDVRAMTLSEWVFGAGRGVDNLACFAIGTGIGGGVVVNGQFHLGNGGAAGEFGHQIVEMDGPACGCGGRGCLELYASGPAIAAMGVKEVLHGHTTRIGELVDYDLNRITADVIVRAAQEGDAIAGEILGRAGIYLGIAVSNVVSILSPKRIVFGGGVARAGDLLLSYVRRTVQERVHVIPVDTIEFTTAALGDEAGLIGAALWARRRQPQLKT